MVKIVLYSEDYANQLEMLLEKFSKEVFGKESCDLELFVNNHWAIYLAIKGNVVVGFSSFNIQDYYGFTDSVVGNDYIYISKEYRTSKAMFLFSIQAGKVSKELNMPLEHYYSSNMSRLASKRLKGILVYETYQYSVEEVAKVTEQLKRRIGR